jgi:hypothetical protein
MPKQAEKNVLPSGIFTFPPSDDFVRMAVAGVAAGVPKRVWRVM